MLSATMLLSSVNDGTEVFNSNINNIKPIETKFNLKRKTTTHQPKQGKGHIKTKTPPKKRENSYLGSRLERRESGHSSRRLISTGLLIHGSTATLFRTRVIVSPMVCLQIETQVSNYQYFVQVMINKNFQVSNNSSFHLF